ncbi:IS3 family transposase [Ideonella sp. 4Y11]|uniref:IS3 family transposase n=2 Tax=Ideonella TaxID=36862 RepID=A0A940YJ40_9BURK|nr:IS3 family transposase [Ideonella aquatica]MBQ0960429.1 IS3 family transposase [Ideonella aquatica]
MRKSKFTEEQIIGFLKQAEAGMAVAEICRKGGFSDATFYKWRAKFGGMDVSEARRLRELEAENAKLKHLLAEAHLDLHALKSVLGGKKVAPQARREMIARLVQEHQLSERRACRLVGLSRDSYRHPPVPSVQTQALKDKIVEIAHVRRRFGYRRVHDLLRGEFPGVNHKRVYRLYSAANLAVRERKKVKRPAMERTPLNIAQHINEVWSMDFVSDSLTNGRRIKCLTVADDFSHECVVIAVDYGISGLYVTRLLDQAARFRGYPAAVRTDNGPEFTSRAFIAWTQEHHIRHILIEPGWPMQNGYIESFNGKFRDECLNEHWFQTLHQARTEIANWQRDYNEVRPHSSIGRIPPARFAEQRRRHAGDAARHLTPTEIH